jgi:hypothetical protein
VLGGAAVDSALRQSRHPDRDHATSPCRHTPVRFVDEAVRGQHEPCSVKVEVDEALCMRRSDERHRCRQATTQGSRYLHGCSLKSSARCDGHPIKDSFAERLLCGEPATKPEASPVSISSQIPASGITATCARTRATPATLLFSLPRRPLCQTHRRTEYLMCIKPRGVDRSRFQHRSRRYGAMTQEARVTESNRNGARNGRRRSTQQHREPEPT